MALDEGGLTTAGKIALGVVLSAALAICVGIAGAPATASPTSRNCGQLPHHGLRAPLPIRATGVSCRRAHKLARGWQRRQEVGEQHGSSCVPPQLREPHRTCSVEGWRCTAGQSPDGETIPVSCALDRRRVKFRVPV
jgi:hypothetical protein